MHKFYNISLLLLLLIFLSACDEHKDNTTEPTQQQSAQNDDTVLTSANELIESMQTSQSNASHLPTQQADESKEAHNQVLQIRDISNECVQKSGACHCDRCFQIAASRDDNTQYYHARHLQQAYHNVKKKHRYHHDHNQKKASSRLKFGITSSHQKYLLDVEKSVLSIIHQYEKDLFLRIDDKGNKVGQAGGLYIEIGATSLKVHIDSESQYANNQSLIIQLEMAFIEPAHMF